MSTYTEKVIKQLLQKPGTFVKIRANKNIKNPKSAYNDVGEKLKEIEQFLKLMGIKYQKYENKIRIPK